ncbi:protein DpdH [Priestia megaterium]|uniref:protein DpdH n=1 Tax=Priestia megaterium TaxID=1404 RepID=UPI002DB9F972|nr:protein DpdH [Priestia megaterium]MEC1071411.1 protein DpdH [Priestia megaterium]
MTRTIKGHICWNEDVISRVLETETEEVLDHTFLASHTPIKMYRELNSSLAESSLIPYSESEFLRDFLKRENYMLATVLGDVGTGKTHLIRWLSARIPKSEKRKVILIPRFGTNIRKIISLILEGMEGPQFDEYRQKLKRVDDDLTPESARELLLGNLAVAIGPNGPHKMHNLTEEEEYMTEALPALLHDTFFRKILLADDGIIHSLTDHVIGSKKKIERITERRKFTKEDLPTDITNIGEAGQDAATIYGELYDDDLKEIAVQWINKHINYAMSKILSFQGGDLVNMMNDVRAELAKDGIELVLLFEDFAVTEGIDSQLLEALLIRPNAADKPLCPIRIAIACTTGYYEELRDTVQTRVELKVSLDVETGNMFTNKDMASFVSRYLNVLRYSDEEVLDWYNEILASGEETDLPSACEKRECPFVDSCHSSFGNSNNQGLFPFNEEAIETMYNRLFKEENPKFNPRTMIKDVIRRTLEDYTSHIRNGSFPPPAMYHRFGGKTKNRLSALDIRQLKTLDSTSSDRREVLLEFWSNSNEIVNLPKTIHEAFNFTDLEGIDSIGSLRDSDNNSEDGGSNGTNNVNPREPEKTGKNQVTVDPNPVKSPKVELPQALIDEIQEIEMWKNNGSLHQTLMQKLRESIFTAINDYIDWDSELLHLNSLKEESIWKQRYVHFVRSTTITPSNVQLILPLDDDSLNDTAIVLQAILYYQHYKHWNFDKGSQYYRYFSRYLHRWSNHVLSQLKELKGKNGITIPVVSIATDTLAIGAALSGRSLGRSLMDSINSLFYPIKDTNENRSASWRRLHEKLKNSDQEIKKYAFARLGVLKGQTKPFKLIDSAQLIKPLQSLRKGEFSAASIQDIGSDFRTLIKIHREIRESFESVIQEELEEREQWVTQMEEGFGPELHVKEGLMELRKAMDSAAHDGSFRGGSNREKLSTLLKNIEAMPVKGWAKQIKLAVEEDNVIKRGQLLGEIDADRMYKAKIFLEGANRFLEESLRSVEKDISDLEQGQESQGIVTVTNEIEQQFALLIDVVDNLKRGGSNDSDESKIITSTH